MGDEDRERILTLHTAIVKCSSRAYILSHEQDQKIKVTSKWYQNTKQHYSQKKVELEVQLSGRTL